MVTSKPITDRAPVVRTALERWVCRVPCSDGDVGDGDVVPRKNAVPVGGRGVGCEDGVVGHFGRGIRPSGVGQPACVFLPLLPL